MEYPRVDLNKRLHKVFEDLREVFYKKKESTNPDEKALLEREEQKLRNEKDEITQEILIHERSLGIDFGEITYGTCAICGDYIWENEVDRGEAFFAAFDPHPPHHNRCLAEFMRTGKILPHHMDYYQNPEKFFAGEKGVFVDTNKLRESHAELVERLKREGVITDNIEINELNAQYIEELKKNGVEIEHMKPSMTWDEAKAFLTSRYMEMTRGQDQDIPLNLANVLSGAVEVPVFACRYYFRPDIFYPDTLTQVPEVVVSDEEKTAVRNILEKKNPFEYVVFASSKNPPDQEKTVITREDLCDTGVLVLFQADVAPDGEFVVRFRALERVKIVWSGRDSSCLAATVTHLPEIKDLDFSSAEVKDKIENIFMVVKDLQGEVFSPDAVSYWLAHRAAIKAGKFGLLLDQFAFYVGRGSEWEEDLFPYRYAVLKANSLIERLEKTNELASYFYNRVKRTRGAFVEQGRKHADDQHKAMIRGQIAALQKQLGEDNEEIVEWEARLNDLGVVKPPLPGLVIKEARNAIKRIKRYKPEDSPYAKIAEWLNNFFSLSWNKRTEDNFDLITARERLEKDHFGLSHINDRIIGYMAFLKKRAEYRKLVEAGQAEWKDEHKRREILCFLGPPGVAKTSLGRSIARSLGRNFYETSFGGVNDAEEIHGFLETFIGSMPGVIIRGIIAADSKNPVFMIDEIDKTSKHRGNPQAAFLALLDSTLKEGFTDKYMRVPFDISEILFIVTANNLDNVLPALVDRMEVIEFSGYTAKQKLEIARRHLVNRANIYHHSDFVIPDATLEAIRDKWTPGEAGVRNYERQIFTVCRKSLVAPSDGVVRPETLSDLLGPEVVHDMPRMTAPEIGVATGLAYTDTGGATMLVEVERYVSETKLSRLEDQVDATGSVEKVMKESMIIALARVRKIAEDPNNEFGITMESFEKSRFHIHMAPLGTKKDGPSGTITIFTAIVSAASGIPVSHKVAMTGELMLRGRALPVGGLAQKFSAAHREGIKKIIYPSQLENTIKHLQKENPELKEMEFVPFKNDREVLAHALLPRKRQERPII